MSRISPTTRRRLVVRVLAFSIISVFVLPCSVFAGETPHNILTPEEKQAGWQLLFDGKTANGWYVHFSSNKKQLAVKDGILDLAGFGDANIRSKETFTEFELSFEYRSDGFGWFGVQAP